MKTSARFLLPTLLVFRALAEAIPDIPFAQDRSAAVTVAPALAGAAFRKIVIDRDDVVYVLTDRGVARMYGDVLAPDRSFRPLADRVPRDLALSPAGGVYLLYDDGWLSNDETAMPKGRFEKGRFDRILPDGAGGAYLFGPGGLAHQATDGPVEPVLAATGATPLTSGQGLLAWTGSDGLVVSTASGTRKLPGIVDATSVAVRSGEILVGTTSGFVIHSAADGSVARPSDARLPWPGITCVRPAAGGVWFGSGRGAFFLREDAAGPYATPSAPGIEPPRIRYYAGRRWLDDDRVVDIALDRAGDVWVLGVSGLRRIEFRRWTLADKAAFFEHKIRSRHIRYGLAAERRMPRPGDIASGEMIDTDNDGGWSSYWLASQALRYAVTRDPAAKRSAWETFEALRRLQTLHTNRGFPARSFERAGGFYVSDPDRWRPAADPDWDWKGHTSSDEIASHTFAYAVLWECAADTDQERRRIGDVLDAVATHILDHDLYLVDIDGKPTLWGRWHPDYVHSFPPTTYDRRLNASEITATLQLAHRLTGKARYRDKALELLEKAGYLADITNSMRSLKATPGVVHQGIVMGDEWNHSDDELGFVTYWVLCRFAFDDRLRGLYRAAVADHLEFERPERFPFWNFVAAACGVSDHDPAGAVWTLRGSPVDTVAWQVSNSHRKDITLQSPGFLGRQCLELLPPGERLIARCNTQPFILDAGDGGHTEFPGDEMVLGYWLGRFCGSIGPAPSSPGGPRRPGR